jgi:hypothetical protein
LRDEEEKRLRKEYNLEYLERAANEDNKDDDKSVSSSYQAAKLKFLKRVNTRKESSNTAN